MRRILGTLALAVALGGEGQTEAQTLPQLSPYLLVPFAADRQGTTGGRFRTDLTIRNGRDVSQNVELRLLPSNTSNATTGGGPPVIIALPPRATRTYVNVVGELLQSPGLAGAILIKGTGPEPGENVFDPAARLVAAHRLYTSAPNGEGFCSQFSDAIPISDLQQSGEGIITGLRQDDHFSTPIGVVNLHTSERTFRVTAQKLPEPVIMDVVVPALSVRQRALPEGTLGSFAVRVELLHPGPVGDQPDWTAYGLSIDNVSADSWMQMLTPAEPLP
jgi:hypothetical protein